MKKSRCTDSQIMDALKRVEAGIGVPDLCRAGNQLRQVLQVAREEWRHEHLDMTQYGQSV